MTSRKLTDTQVLRIRQRAAEGESYGALARAYEVSDTAISGICQGRIYRNLGGPLSKKRDIDFNSEGLRKISDNQVMEIRRRAAEGENLQYLHTEYGITAKYLRRLLDGGARSQAGGPSGRVITKQVFEALPPAAPSTQSQRDDELDQYL